MKKAWIWVVAIVVISVLGYLGIKNYRSGYSGIYGTATTPSYANTTPQASPEAGGNTVTTKSGVKGDYLVGGSGMTLYIFDIDSVGVSNCSGSCAGLWPPYTTPSVPVNLPTGVATITRSDGSIQFTYKGLPIYYYAGDTQIGDLNGDGVGGTWHLVKP
jgi:predicted lipoprotein with Yx(FWY)xxD motif